MSDTVFRDVELPEGRRDVVARGGIVADITAPGTAAGATIIDGRGGALLPGLHDHHLHLHAMAAAADSVRCGPPDVTDLDALESALVAAQGDWIRGVGYTETVGGLLDRAALDLLVPARPVRIQHRSGALWILNSPASELVGLDRGTHPGIERDANGIPTGRLWRADDWLRAHLPHSPPPDLRAVGQQITRSGITGVTDATPDLSSATLDALVAAHRTGAVPQRLQLLGVGIDDTPSFDDTITIGPYKIVIADSALPDFEDLADTIRRAHACHRPVAVHCVSRVALALLLAAFDDVGVLAGDRIEHGSIIGADAIADLAARGLRVVTQPGFVTDRGDDYLRRVDAGDLPDLYRCRSLLAGGVHTAMSSDAPYGPLDPWVVIAAAVQRRAPTGEIVGAGERVTAAEALDGYLAPLDDPGGPPRRVQVGADADLVLLDRPLADALAAPAAQRVTCTVVRGQVLVE